MKRILISTGILLSCLACSPADRPEAESSPYLTLLVDRFELGPDACEVKVPYRANVGFTVSMSDDGKDWIRVAKTLRGKDADTLLLQIHDNWHLAPKESVVTLSATEEGLTASLTIWQDFSLEKYGPYLHIDDKTVSIGADFTETTLTFLSTWDWKAENEGNLLVLTPSEGNGSAEPQQMSVRLAPGVRWDDDLPPIYIDSENQEIKVQLIPTYPPEPLPEPGTSLKFMEYNILYGMRDDAASNFNNFVGWVREQSPDVLAMVECVGFSEASMAHLAMRYKHPYSAFFYTDGWNVALTSKYPVEIVERTKKGFYHGALYVKVLDLNVIVIHTSPQLGVLPDSQPYDGPDWDGDGLLTWKDFRINEFASCQEIMKRHPEEENWIITGDFNCRSRQDVPFIGYGWTFTEHDWILGQGIWTDLVRLVNPDTFWPSFCTIKYPAYGKQRLDFVYGTEGIAGRTRSAWCVYDDFTEYHSDHYPVVVEILAQ